MNIPETTQVQRKTNLPHDQFLAEHLAQSRPVILTDAISHWKALTQWTPKFFLERYGSATVIIDGKSYAMADFIQSVLHSEQDHPAPYLRNYLIERYFPELLPESCRCLNTCGLIGSKAAFSRQNNHVPSLSYISADVARPFRLYTLMDGIPMRF